MNYVLADKLKKTDSPKIIWGGFPAAKVTLALLHQATSHPFGILPTAP